MSKLMKIFLVLCMFFGLIQLNNVEANANDGKLTSYQINDFKSEVSIDSEIYPPIFEDISFTLSEELSDFNIELYYKLDDGSTYSFYADDHLYVDPLLKWKSENLEFLYLMLSWWDDNGYYQEYYSKYDAETLSQYTYIDENSKVYYSNMDYSFSINNAQIDTVAPEIKDYKVVQNGDTLEFTFDIVEEASGIDYIEIYASEDIYFFISGSSLKGNSPYKVTREIGHYGINMDYGTYRVYGPQVYDKAGNRSDYDASYQFELKEEYNILESLIDEDIFVATNYMDGKLYFRKDETLAGYCNNVYLAYLDEEGNEERLGDSVTVEMNEIDFTQENPTYKTTLSYRINSKTEKTVEVEVDVILVDERIGTVLNANNVQELAFNYEKFINGEYDFSFVSGIVPAYVKLDSGEVILEMLKPGGFGEAPGIDGEGVHYIDTGGSGYYYPYYRTEKGEDNGVIATTFHIYLIDNDGNIRDQEGNILLEYSDRRSAKYHSLNDNVSMSWLEGTLPSYTEILVEDVSNEVELDGNNVAYDITLMADYQEVQPVGDVDVTVQLPENLQGKEVDVYYIDDEGKQELIEETSFTDKEVTFTTNHFSTYAVVEKGETKCPFIDINVKKWYYPYVKEAYELGLMTGTTEDTFAPDGNMTRGMVAVVMHRIAGTPTYSYRNIFPDVPSKKYCATAITWAFDNEIITGFKSGKDAGKFLPDGNITRQDLALILYRYATSLGIDTSGRKDISTFVDHKEVSKYAREAIEWVTSVGIITGTKENELKPQANATRAECAKMLSEFYKLVEIK